MGEVWFTSDTHFGHENIIKLCHRPFKDVTEMNQIIFNNWSAVVAPEDEIYHLGDLALLKKDNGLMELISGLNGVKHLVLGNHDKYSRTRFREVGFEDIIHTPIIYHGFILSHAPMPIMSHKCKANIHGHIHNNKQETYVNGKNIYYNVSTECSSYTPINFNTILSYYNRSK